MACVRSTETGGVTVKGAVGKLPLDAGGAGNWERRRLARLLGVVKSDTKLLDGTRTSTGGWRLRLRYDSNALEKKRRCEVRRPTDLKSQAALFGGRPFEPSRFSWKPLAFRTSLFRYQ